jgi:hypothetical protein
MNRRTPAIVSEIAAALLDRFGNVERTHRGRAPAGGLINTGSLFFFFFFFFFFFSLSLVYKKPLLNFLDHHLPLLISSENHHSISPPKPYQ